MLISIIIRNNSISEIEVIKQFRAVKYEYIFAGAKQGEARRVSIRQGPRLGHEKELA